MPTFVRNEDEETGCISYEQEDNPEPDDETVQMDFIHENMMLVPGGYRVVKRAVVDGDASDAEIEEWPDMAPFNLEEE